MQLKETVNANFNPNESELSCETSTLINAATPPHNWRPLSVVVVRNARASDGDSNNDDSSTRTTTSGNLTPAAASSAATPCQAHNQKGFESRSIDRPVPLQFPSPSFALMPRNGVSAMWNLSPMSGASGCRDSRKRRAHSMSSPPCSDTEEDEDHSDLPVFVKEDSSAPTGGAGAIGSDLLNMERLTLHSPAKQPLKPEVQSCRQLFRSHNSVRSGASSFSVYVSSPAESIHRSTSGSLSGCASSIVASRTPCSSTNSSPRHIPLTILPPQSQQAVGPSPVRIQLPNGRPPCHFAHSKIPGRVEIFSSPRSTSRSLLDQHIDVKRTPDTRNSSIEAYDDLWTPRTDEAPSTNDGTTPKTPLPRITLTPRTPGSARRSHTSGLPMFPVSYVDDSSPKASVDVDTVGIMMDDLLEGFVGYLASSSPDVRPRDEEFPSLTFDRDSPQSLALSDASAVGVTTPPTVAKTAASPVRFSEWKLRKSNSFSGSNEGGALSLNPVDHGSKSVMTLTGGSDSFPSEVLGGVDGMDADTGSLSDTDDEDFVLACPLSLSIQQRVNLSPISTTRRVKQRQRCPNDAGIALTGYGSFASMTSNQVSATSLFGMDIVHEESGCDASGTPRGMPSFRGVASASTLFFKDVEHRSLCRIKDGDSSSSMARGKSDLSLGSLGLYLEERSCDTARDLVTPPAFVEHAISPPPLMKKIADPDVPFIKSPPSAMSSACANWHSSPAIS